MSRISSYELTEWEAHERRYGPLGPERADLLAAMIMQRIYNSQISKPDQAKPLTEFMPDWSALTVEEADPDGDD